MILNTQQLKTLKESHPDKWQMILGAIYWQIEYLYGEWGLVSETDLQYILDRIDEHNCFSGDWLEEVENYVRHP